MDDWKEKELDIESFWKKTMFEERKINTTTRKVMIPPGIQARAGLQMQEGLLIYLPWSIREDWFPSQVIHQNLPTLGQIPSVSKSRHPS